MHRFAGFTVLAGMVAVACVARQPPTALQPRVISHAQWDSTPPVGHAADAARRNLRPGDSMRIRDLTVHVAGTRFGTAPGSPDVVRLRLQRADSAHERDALEGGAFDWNGYRVAIIAIYGPGELGNGLVALELATLASLPTAVASSGTAGGAEMRLRIPHRITHVTLHHTGSPEPLRPDESPVEKLRGLQSWGARERNWWDVPYHYLIDLDGRIYEGRDWRYMGETNTTYDPSGHFLISIIGNYQRQEATPAQIEAIADMMAWAIRRFDLPLDRIGGHYQYAQTTCPGVHLRRYLEDGTLRRKVSDRLAR